MVTTLGLTACGDKGKLKSPSQIAAGEAKKAHKKQEQEKEVAPVPALHNPNPTTPPMGPGIEGGALPSPDNSAAGGGPISPGKGSQGQGQ